MTFLLLLILQAYINVGFYGALRRVPRDILENVPFVRRNLPRAVRHRRCDDDAPYSLRTFNLRIWTPLVLLASLVVLRKVLRVCLIYSLCLGFLQAFDKFSHNPSCGPLETDHRLMNWSLEVNNAISSQHNITSFSVHLLLDLCELDTLKNGTKGWMHSTGRTKALVSVTAISNPRFLPLISDLTLDIES